MMSFASLNKVGYTQFLNTCVLASYAVACYPFTGTPILDYFIAYCQYFNLSLKHPERSYDEHFHQYCHAKGLSGYKVIEELHRGGVQEPFARASANTKLARQGLRPGRHTTGVRESFVFARSEALPGKGRFLRSAVV